MIELITEKLSTVPIRYLFVGFPAYISCMESPDLSRSSAVLPGDNITIEKIIVSRHIITMYTGKPLEKLTLPVAIGVAEIAVMIVLETTE